MPLYLRISLFCILTHFLKQFYHYIHDIFSLFLLYGFLKRNSTLIPFGYLSILQSIIPVVRPFNFVILRICDQIEFTNDIIKHNIDTKKLLVIND